MAAARCCHSGRLPEYIRPKVHLGRLYVVCYRRWFTIWKKIAAVDEKRRRDLIKRELERDENIIHEKEPVFRHVCLCFGSSVFGAHHVTPGAAFFRTSATDAP